jgi:monomeric isocitrate dehydrogenase
MGAWSSESKLRLYRWIGDFTEVKKSVTITEATDVKYNLFQKTATTVLKANYSLNVGEIIDSSMHLQALKLL